MHPTTLAALAAFPQQLEAHFAAFPAELRNQAPSSWHGVPSEALTAIEQVCHVRDIEIDGYLVRFHRTLTEEHPTLASIDTDAMARERDYGQSDAEAALAAFRAARLETLALIGGLAQEQFDRTAMFEGYGPVTLRSLVHYLCSHDQQHLAGLQWLLGKLESDAAPMRNPNRALRQSRIATAVDPTLRMRAHLHAVHPVLMARDVSTSVQFYVALGFRVAFQDDAQAPRYAVVVRDAVELHLQWQDATQWAHAIDRPTYRLRVDDPDVLYAEFGAANALPAEGSAPRSPWSSPGDTPWGTREFHVLDPAGNGLQFYAPLAKA